MDGISKDIVGIIFQLLPGFLVAWIVYGITAHLRPSSFERIVQALIFTVFVRAMLIVNKSMIIAFGNRFYSFGIWNNDVEFVWSIIIAVFLGLFVSWCINNDFPLFLFRKDGEDRCNKFCKWLYILLSKTNLTDKTLHPSEWYTAFNSEPRYIVLHLKGERRLCCWPRQYPDDPQKGHFLVEEAEWLLDDGSSAPLYSVKQVLIQASDVERIEFLKNTCEISTDPGEIEKAMDLLTNLYKKEAENDDKCAEATT
jgi:hypothetical protein